MKKIILHIILLILPFATIVALVNIKFDNRDTFSTIKYEQNIANIVLQHHNVENLDYFDDRIFYKNVITKLPYTPNVAMIGTSRCVEVSNDFFNNKTFINSSFLKGSIKDYIAVIGMLDSCKKIPDSVYLDTSPFLVFEEDNNNYESVYEYYNYGVKVLQLPYKPTVIYNNEWLNKFKMLFSFENFQKNIKERKLHKYTSYKDVGLAEPHQKMGRRFDASMVYEPNKFNVDTLKIIADIAFFESKIVKQNTIDSNTILVFNKIIQYFISKNKKVFLVNVPLQINYYKHLKTTWQHFTTVQNEIIKVAKQNNISLIGTFNAEEAQINSSYFFDQRHCSQAALKKVFKMIQF